MKALKLISTSVLLAAVGTSNLLIAEANGVAAATDSSSTSRLSVTEKVENSEGKEQKNLGTNIQERIAETAAKIKRATYQEFVNKGFNIGLDFGWDYIVRKEDNLGLNFALAPQASYLWQVSSMASLGIGLKPMFALHNSGIRGVVASGRGTLQAAKNVFIAADLGPGWNFAGKTGLFLQGGIGLNYGVFANKLLVGLRIGFASAVFGGDSAAAAAAAATAAATAAKEAAATPATPAKEAAATPAKEDKPSESGKNNCVNVSLQVTYFI